MCSMLGSCVSDIKLLDNDSNDNVQNNIASASNNDDDDDDTNDDLI